MNDIVTEKYIPLLQKLIRNGCVNTGDPGSGGEERSAAALAEYFAGCGLKGEILSSRQGRSNLLLKIPGTDPAAPSLMFMGHMDVVPADPAGWSHPPFSGEIARGRLWGRGSLDMLGQTAAMAVAFGEIYRSGVKFPGDLLFLAVADEETAGIYGAKWLTETHWEKVKADFMITELGGFYLDLPGGASRKAVFTVGEKGITQVRLKFRGTASHASLPFGIENAVAKAARTACSINSRPPAPETGAFFQSILKALELPPALTAGLSRGETLPGALSELAQTSPGTARLLHACSQMTVSPNTFTGGSKVNIIPARAEMEVDIRTLPGQGPEDWQNYLKTRIEEVGLGGEVEIEEIESFGSTASELHTPLMRACRNTAEKIAPETSLVPLLTSVATDGRFWRERGTCVYGFSLFAEDADMNSVFSLIHGIDESVSLESLERGYSFFRALPEAFFAEAGGGRRYRAVRDYGEAPENPITISAGEILKVVEESDPQGDWPNWVFCRGEEKEGWVPKQILRIDGTEAAASEEYTAREHNLTEGDVLIARRELNGWIWGVKEREPGLPGWAPLNCLERIP